MAYLIDKNALVAEIERRIKETESMQPKFDQFWAGQISAFKGVLKILDTLEVKEVDIDKLCEFRKNIGFAYPDGASEYQKQLACYRQGIKDAIKAQKGE